MEFHTVSSKLYLKCLMLLQALLKAFQKLLVKLSLGCYVCIYSAFRYSFVHVGMCFSFYPTPLNFILKVCITEVSSMRISK